MPVYWCRKLAYLTKKYGPSIMVHRYPNSNYPDGSWRAYFIRNGICECYTTQCYETSDLAVKALFNGIPRLSKYINKDKQNV